ncbi:hypothetical protein [Clostridium aminobutyricum]|uniref:Uncharacterized protein n=1 Tax=Clostridium aminobutyricum TaxID=33953 RepID=A0A939D6K9_CLOAM|nr:hypothetical protein [Clostridium aminobutyricum]MBN7772479.1 hypothetical protein [Clostridium aminobutyricum]
MRNKILLVLSSIVVIIGSGILNFNEFLMGSPANIKNVMVTFLYIIFWILFLVIGIKLKSKILLKYSLAFWLITLFAAGMATYANITDHSPSIGLPFVACFLGQWYGLDFSINNYTVTNSIILLISLLMSATVIVFLIRIGNEIRLKDTVIRK